MVMSANPQLCVTSKSFLLQGSWPSFWTFGTKAWEKLFISSANFANQTRFALSCTLAKPSGGRVYKDMHSKPFWQLGCGISMRRDSSFKLSHVCTTQPQRQSLKAPHLIYWRFLAASQHRLMIWGRSSSFAAAKLGSAGTAGSKVIYWHFQMRYQKAVLKHFHIPFFSLGKYVYKTSVRHYLKPKKVTKKKRRKKNHF